MGSAMTVPRGPSVTPPPREKPQVRPTLQPAVTMASRRFSISGRALTSRDLSIRSHVFTPTYAALRRPLSFILRAEQMLYAAALTGPCCGAKVLIALHGKHSSQYCWTTAIY